MDMNIVDVKIETVKLGYSKVLGLLGSDGNQYVALYQLADILGTGNVIYQSNQRVVDEIKDMSKVLCVHFGIAPWNYKPIPMVTRQEAEYAMKVFVAKGNQTAQQVMLGNYHRKSPRHNHIYVVMDAPRSVAKIGVTTNLKTRVSQIQTHYPYELSLWFAKATSEGAYAYDKEQAIHKELYLYRLHGEWFDTSGLMLIDWVNI